MGHGSRLRRRMLLATLGLMVGWTALLWGSLYWETRLLTEQVVSLARFHAAGAFERDLVYRAWNARMGGVYAPVTHVAPNPYLKVESRDIDSDIGPLTLVNPSYMTRIVHGIAEERTGILSRITSLDPVRPANAPQPWERRALERFEAGAQDHTEQAVTGEGVPILRYMRPLTVDESCLTCHDTQGYALGDVRGGISVTIPMTPVQAIQAPTRAFSVTWHLAVWAVGLAGIAMGGRIMTRQVGQLEDARSEALADRRRAEESDQAKSRFLATMSHELRTPLNAILGFSQMMEQKVLGPLGTPTYEEYARDIRTSGEHLLALVNDVLDLSKIESGRMVLTEGPVDLGAEVVRTTGLMMGQANARGVRLDVDVQPALPLIRGDGRVIRQMLMNIVANALRFTPEGGRVLVTANMDPEDCARVMVSDTGQGIPDADLQIVLEPFQQGSNVSGLSGARGGLSDRPAFTTGTGLGLALVKGFIELHAGSLILASEPGHGTTVTLRFPAWRVLAGEASPPPQPA
ncbi:ATP-binding protein [Roseospira navarrensis]|uniref:histidine kinase n=1 Tax=Roseospira navarrensis TaxID=140058 RepID=A0A7X2D2C7_9PROT|nr:ATP-binding protein [Roseospira navarrensis]MQX36159.1 DUF3365 domain-containing protein [Roseospira navarrensis]